MKNAFFNRMKFIFLASLCIFCSICFFACSNLISSDDSCSDDGKKNSEKMYEIKGNLFVEGSAPKIIEKTGQARSVSANIPDTIFYAVSAKNAENPEKTYTAQVSGSAFSIKLEKGTWNITAEGFSDSEKTVSVLKGSASVSIADENSVKSGISIKMLPQKDGKGNISLSIEAESGSGIKSVSAELTKNGEGSSVYSERLNFYGNAAKIEKSEISSGVYLLSLKFYSGNDGYGELLYTAQEIVNVFNNLTTDTWQGNSVYFNGGKFEVSKSAVESFKMNTFFVQGESETTYTPVKSADDSNAGTYFAPLATVQAAVDKINAINDGTTEYTIFVDGTVTADSNGNYSENNSSFVNISPASTLSLAIKSLSSENAVVDAGRNGQNADTTGWRAFYIGANAKVAFENITVTGGSLDSSGGGIYCDGNLSLKNCTVNGNINYNDGNLTLEGAVSVENSIKISTGLQIGIKNLASLKTLKLSGKTDAEEWNVGTEIIHSADGTALSDLICSKFAVQNKNADKKVLCIVLSSMNAEKGVLAIAGGAVIPSFNQPEYTLTLSPALFSSAKTDNKISLAVTESDGNAVTPDSVEFALYQNKNKVAVLQGGLLPSWIPEGNYTVIAAAKIGGYSYDVEKNIIISENIAISSFSSAPSASDFPKITASSSQELVTLRSWVNSGSDLEGITITLVDDVDLADCADDWQPIGFVSESENRPFKGTFDGQGHSLSFDIGNIDSSNRFRKIGVFYKNDGVIENLVISQYLQDGKTLIIYGNSSQYAYSNAGGGICIENSGIVRNCINKSSIIASTFSDIGGICMSNAETGIIENCLFSGSITMNAKCSNGGDNQKSAGICPRNNGIIKNCVSNGSITTEAETDQNQPDAILNNISGAISVYTEGFIENCYWLKNNIKSGSSSKNRIAYTKSTYKKLTCIPDPSRITGCGYFETNSPSASVVAGTTSECKSAQTVAYSGTLIQMLNAYVAECEGGTLAKWGTDSSGNLTLDF